jgi:ribonuclease VapC
VNKERYCLDASALLCVLLEEPGADYITERLTAALVSATSYAEVIAKLVDRGAPAEDVVTIMADLDIEIVPVDRKQAELSGWIHAATREAGLSIGDRACLALALTRRAVAVTMDPRWRHIDCDIEIEIAR